MLRPERMSKVSVTGSQGVLGEVIETVHDLNLLHVSDYNGAWEGFETGTPLRGAESASGKLVTVRSLKSILGVTEEDAGPARIVTEEALDEQLEEIRTEVNELDDRRSDVNDDLRRVNDRIDAAEPFVDLGIDLDLLAGYEHLSVAVGEGDEDEVERALADADDVTSFEVFTGEETVAAFAYPADDAALDEALVGAEFARVEVPDASGDPEEYVAELEHDRQKLRSRLTSVESELENLRLEYAGFLLAAEETLAIKVQKTEIPLQLATTDHAFVAEGWVPTEEYGEFVATLHDAVGEHVEIEELERASYEPSHPAHGHGDAAAGEEPAVADGGHVTVPDDPPVVQDNPKPVKPFELLVETINRPRYFEIDPTVVLFLTFPVFYGFMIGDLGYGILYTAIGWWLASSFDSDAFKSLGRIAMWAGVFTAVFGVLYGEIFGFHLITEYVWVGALGMEGPPLEKGLHATQFAQTWLVLSLLVGLVHLTTGYVFGFLNDLNGHGVKDAILENASWILLMNGLFVWIFSTHAQGETGPRPPFLFQVFNGEPFALGFGGFSPVVGQVGLVVAAVGLVLLVAGEGIVGALESPDAFVNVISYTRIAAVLLAKAGMAFVVNLLVFGAYEIEHGGEAVVHFTLNGHVPEGAHVLFGGLVHMGAAGVLGGLIVLVVGHALVLALGVTSAGLQAVRLEYVEFFGKFYDGGGQKYEPFGYQRTYTTED
ncbi:V-type ATP synthase subunit I [Halobacteriaceae archaeon GCM10025711]